MIRAFQNLHFKTDISGAMTKASTTPSGGTKRQRQTVPVARLLQRLLTPAARRQGFAETAVIADWPEIVGSELAKRCQPLKVSRGRGPRGGTLVVQAPPVMTLELQHSAPQIIERINTYFGFSAIVKMRLVAGPMPRAKAVAAKSAKTLSAKQAQTLSDATAEIEMQGLKQALEALGHAVMLRNGS